MSDRINQENYRAATQYAAHHSRLPTEAQLTEYLRNNRIRMQDGSECEVPFRRAILELLDFHYQGIPMPPPLSRGYLKRTRGKRRVRKSRKLPNLRAYKQR